MSPANPTSAIADPGLAGRCRHQPTPFLPARSSRRHSHNFGGPRRAIMNGEERNPPSGGGANGSYYLSLSASPVPWRW